jgi:predicted ATPase/DNA-binding SARP family transcriptional activator
MELSVHLLAGVRVVRDGQELPVTSRRQRAVVAALGLSPGRSVSAEQLIDALWGDEPPDGARATLQTYVSRLRGLLGDDAVLYGPGGYRLADGARSDVELARQLADEARRALTADPRRALEAARRALALWDGRALAELADDPWFVPVATGLNELRTNLVDLAGEALTVAGRSDEAVELLEPATRRDPLRERSQVLLIDALRLSGRNVDAVRVAGRYRRELRDETGLEPGPALTAAEQRALAAEPSAAPPVAQGPVDGSRPTLPRPNRLIGRERDLAEIAAALRSARLVTVCGPGGVGKTRLIAELEAQLAESTETIVVELAPAVPGDVVAAVAAAVRLRSDRPTDVTIADHLRDVDAVFFVDNAEHVTAEVCTLARVLLDRCPRLRLVVTSRARLDLPDEHVHVLAPLGTTGEHPPAAELFGERLARAGRARTADPDDVQWICARLDGIPLALELAAGRAAVLGVRGLRDRLGTALDLLTNGSGDTRHANLRRVVAWSYDLLDEPSQHLLATLSVFDGEFDLDAAEHVGSHVLRAPVSLLLGRLVDASLVATTTAVPGRYRLLEMIRQFGREQLVAHGDADQAGVAHLHWVSNRLHEIHTIIGPDEPTISARLDRIRDEIRGALRWALTQHDTRLATTVLQPLAGPLLYRPDAELIHAGYALVRHSLDETAIVPPPPALPAAGARLAFLAGELGDVDRLAELALEHSTSDLSARHRAAHARGVLRLYQARYEDAMAEFAAVTDDDRSSLTDRLDALGGLGLAQCYRGDDAQARTIVERLSAIADTVDSDTYRAFADYMRGEIDLASGRLESATSHLRTATEKAWNVGASFIWGIAATVLAAVLVRHRPVDEARRYLPVLLDRWRRTATWTQLWTTLRLVAELLADHDDANVAALVLLAAERDPAAPQLIGDDRDRSAKLAIRLREQLGEARYEGIATAVAEFERVDVLERALAALDQLQPG